MADPTTPTPTPTPDPGDTTAPGKTDWFDDYLKNLKLDHPEIFGPQDGADGSQPADPASGGSQTNTSDDPDQPDGPNTDSPSGGDADFSPLRGGWLSTRLRRIRIPRRRRRWKRH